MNEAYTINHIARIWSEDHQWSEATMATYLRLYCKHHKISKPYRLTRIEAQHAMMSMGKRASKWTVRPYPSLDYAHCLKCGKGLTTLDHLCRECREDEVMIR